MIRWATEDDRAALLQLMQATGQFAREYRYDSPADWSATVLVDEDADGIRGFVSFQLGRPETWVRQIVVAPAHQGGHVAKNLLAHVIRLALASGSQGVEGYHLDTRPHVADLAQRTGATLTHGNRIRFPLTPAATEKAQKVRAHLHRSYDKDNPNGL